ncbi:MAG: hypothetical protein IT291_01730 [Deltaproteobacteria bacterium]|nr:hypothetical protein [Deltaproteobacteria bacterium]
MSLKRSISSALMSLAFSGCSVFMAAHADKAPDDSVLRVGNPKSLVEAQFNNIISSHKTRSGSVTTYQFFTNDEKSYGRAATYAVVDIATLGLAEVFTTPVEALQGDKHVIVVTYDMNDRIRKVERHQAVKALLPKPEKALGIEK